MLIMEHLELVLDGSEYYIISIELKSGVMVKEKIGFDYD